MLRISKKTDYGLLLLSTLAKSYPDKLVSLSEIAQQNHLPLPYLRQIAQKLHKAGIIYSKEGIGGGYQLTKQPATITMSEVITIFEGSIAPVACLDVDNSCVAEENCTTRKVWQALYGDMIHKFNTTTLKELV